MFILLFGQNRCEDYCLLCFQYPLCKNHLLEIRAKKKDLSFQMDLFS